MDPLLIIFIIIPIGVLVCFILLLKKENVSIWKWIKKKLKKKKGKE